MCEHSKPLPLWQRLSAPSRSAFLSAVILGLMVHLFAFSNIIPNSDGLSRIFDEQQMTVSGRWFLHYASMFHGYIQAPGLIGGLSLLFLATAAALIVDALEIRSTTVALLCGGFAVVFPALAYTYLYMFTASAYAFAILLAVFSVWIVRKKPRLFWLGAIPLACAVGTYQAYFAVAVSLALSCVILDLLNLERDLKDTVRNGFRVLIMLALGAAVYYIMMKLFLFIKGVELLSYKGMDSVSLSLGAVRAVYREFIYYFLRPDTVRYVGTPMICAHLALIGLAGICVLIPVLKQKLYQQPLRMVLLAVGAALVPLAFNFTQLVSEASPITRYSFVFVYLLCAALAERMWEASLKHIPWVRITACTASALLILLCAQVCNLAYTSSATAHRATQTFAANLVGRVEAMPGYQQDMEVVIIGPFPRSVYYSGVEEFSQVEHYSCMSSTVLSLNKHVYYYLNDWLNVPWSEPAEETMVSVSDSEAFQSMPLYPDDGSIVIEDGRVIVKLAEKYIPKQPYELAYEERK